MIIWYLTSGNVGGHKNVIFSISPFPIWFRIRPISAGLEPIISHAEKSCKLSYYIQSTKNIKIKRLKPVLLTPRGRKLSIIRCDKFVFETDFLMWGGRYIQVAIFSSYKIQDPPPQCIKEADFKLNKCETPNCWINSLFLFHEYWIKDSRNEKKYQGRPRILVLGREVKIS